MKKILKKKASKTPVWNLNLLYKSSEDPQIEIDMAAIEKMAAVFAEKYRKNTAYLSEPKALLEALTEYEKMSAYFECKPLYYFYYSRDIDSENKKASQMMQLLSSRISKAGNLLVFFDVALGKIPQNKQKEFLRDSKLAHFKVFLERVFDDAQHILSEAEEKILNLKSQPASSMWSDGNERLLNKRSVMWKGKQLPLSAAMQKIHDTHTTKDRYALDALVAQQLKEVGEFAESEINAVYTDKKINDELRGYKLPFEGTIRSYRNDIKVVEELVKTVTESAHISHRFYKLKAKMLKLKKLKYADRNIGVGEISTKFNFDQSVDILKKIVTKIDPKYTQTLDQFLVNGQIDVAPRLGKTSGAYCSSSSLNPTFVLLNHTDSYDSFSTLAHEMGHAFHSMLCHTQGPIYANYSMSLAESASTLFQTIAIDEVTKMLPEKEQIIALYDRINDDVATIFRQIACFNFEKDLHAAVRTRGYLSKEDIGELHNINMKAYLGPLFTLTPEDGNFFVTWGHIRRFFYVYSYAYGQLVSKALLRRYRQDKSFWTKIEQYLAAGGKDSPENILMEIGLDVSKPEFWKEGLREIENDLDRLEKLVMKKK